MSSRKRKLSPDEESRSTKAKVPSAKIHTIQAINVVPEEYSLISTHPEATTFYHEGLSMNGTKIDAKSLVKAQKKRQIGQKYRDHILDMIKDIETLSEQIEKETDEDKRAELQMMKESYEKRIRSATDYLTTEEAFLYANTDDEIEDKELENQKEEALKRLKGLYDTIKTRRKDIKDAEWAIEYFKNKNTKDSKERIERLKEKIKKSREIISDIKREQIPLIRKEIDDIYADIDGFLFDLRD